MGLVIFAIIMLVVGFTALTGAPYVPSKRRDIESALTSVYPVGASDVVVDLGSGDGKVLRLASRLGARAIGYEIHPILVMISAFLSRGDRRVQVRLSNFWRAKLPDDVTVVYVFIDTRDKAKLWNYLAAEAGRIGRPIWLVSYAFQFGQAKRSDGRSYLYEVAPGSSFTN